jgi:putative glycosyl hydrolase/Big-like domain-containing protein
LTRLGIVVSVLVLSLLAASPARAARSEFFGIAQGALDAQDAQRMADVGVRTERFMLKWRSVEATPGSYDWSDRDWLVGALASRGIRPVPFVWGSPSWVGSGAAARPPLDSAADVEAWQDFLQAAVARYGPGGSYWSNGYRQRFGADAVPLPIRSWQIWNEPNLSKYFDPGQTVDHAAQRYARLLHVSHDAIKSRDPQAQIVLAGMPGFGDTTAWVFLDNLYAVPGAKDDFDVAALHPYAQGPTELQMKIDLYRAVMTDHGDEATPLWLTELAWGSGAPDQFGYNKGLTGQRDLLTKAFRLILNNRTAWNVQRIYWFLWHDPDPDSGYARLCSICGTAGLVRYDRTPKPAYDAFKAFTAETTPPVASMPSGPTYGSFTNDPTPDFTFASSEPGSTFACHFDAQSFKPCATPFSGSLLSDGPHTLYVKAIDAPGNESAVRWRAFTVDTQPPEVAISSGPAPGSTGSDPQATFGFATNDPSAKLECELDDGGFENCSSPFSTSHLPDGSHTFRVRATDKAQNTDLAARSWTVDTTPPTVTITSGPGAGSTSSNRSAAFGFASDEPDVSFGCRLLGSGVFRDCGSPFTASGLADGAYTFQVKATDAAENTHVTSRTWTVDGPADVSITGGLAFGAVSKDPTPSFVFSSLDAESSFSCQIDDAPFASCSSPFTTSKLSDGRHTFRVQATDVAETTDIAWRRFKVDVTAPVVKIDGRHKVKTRRRKASAAFVLKASERVGRRCRIDSRRFRSCSWRYKTPRLRRGTHTLKVKAVDRVGNVGTKHKRFRIVRR